MTSTSSATRGRTGPRLRDAITDVAGLRVGHWTDRRGATGCTVVLCPPEGAIAACAVLGGAPGTRETDVLLPGNLVKRVHAVLLTGGSAFGLDAASGVMRWLRERNIGFETRAARVPIVPAAVIYDLGIGRAGAWPDAEAGYAACAAASRTVRRASEVVPGGAVVGAIVSVNAVGEIIDPSTARIVAGLRADLPLPSSPPRKGTIPASAHGRGLTPLEADDVSREALPGENSTIAVVATDVLLDREQLYRVALMAHTGLARAIRPSHSPADGDIVFALSTGARVEEPPNLLALGALAARALERAIVDGVRSAATLAGIPAVGMPPRVRPIQDKDRPWIEGFTARAWGSAVIASRGNLHRPSKLDGFVTASGGAITGLITLHVEGDACEVVTLNSIIENAGNGTALMAAAERYARERGCHRLWLLTTNDNTHALRFYQRLGMRIAAIYPGAVDEERRLKPEIPSTGRDGIPIHDEIELEKRL
jgi:L-aminopeptidase/D-esterase-like protein/N-acetylglutamate synthase-like GNAT family acetyltransferase